MVEFSFWTWMCIAAVACWIISPFIIRWFDPCPLSRGEHFVLGLIWLFLSQLIVVVAAIIGIPILIGKALDWKT